MADSRGTTKGIPKLQWKRLATLGDIQRGLRNVLLRLNAGRIDTDKARTMGGLLRIQADLITMADERRQRQSGDERPEASGDDESRSTDELISIVKAGRDAAVEH
jgi:hypothetical protein